MDHHSCNMRAVPARRYVDPASKLVARWEWVSASVTPGRPTDVSGGPFDDVITSLAVSVKGVLVAGTPSTLNAQHLNGSVFRVDSRAGLPFASVTVVAADGAGDGRVWVGTSGGGASLWDPATGRFKYFYGPRYLPGDARAQRRAPLRAPRRSLGASDKQVSCVSGF